MRIDVLTLFPEVFTNFLSSSILKRAIEQESITVNVHNYRDFSTNKHNQVDDYSYGGGAGMVIQVEPIVKALRNIEGNAEALKILTSPSGITYNQKVARRYKQEKHIIIVCGHYEGIDDRITNYIDEEVSIGDYILTGGELAALIIIDSIARLIPGVLGNEESTLEESFESGLLEYPQYTRPYEFEGLTVPDVLISGNHEKINAWRRFKSLEKTYKVRPDLLDEDFLSSEDEKFLKMIKEGNDFEI